MQRFRATLVTAMVGVFVGAALGQEAAPGVEVMFSPKGGVGEAIVKQIEQAKSSIKIEAPALGVDKIAKALVAAQERGVKVQAILDKAGAKAKDSQAAALKSGDVAVMTTKATLNSRNIIIDDKVVLTGSYSLTKSGEQSVETLLILRDTVVPKFVANFDKIAKEATPLEAAKEVVKATEEGGEDGDTAAKEVSASKSDGESEDEGEDEPKGKYVYSKSAKTYHLAECSFAKRIKEDNRVYTDEVPESKSPCKKCIKE